MKYAFSFGLLTCALLSTTAWAQPPEGMENEGDASYHNSEMLRGPQYDHSVQPKHHEGAKKAHEIELESDASLVEPTASVNFVTGGIGDEERAAIEGAKADYNTYITSARADGAFLDDAAVIIRNKAGEVLVDLTMGPLLYVKLPVGSYVLDATSGEEKKTQNFTISPTKKTATIRLTFKSADDE